MTATGEFDKFASHLAKFDPIKVELAGQERVVHTIWPTRKIQSWEDGACSVVDMLLSDPSVWPDGNILVFCPGAAEIDRLYDGMREVLKRYPDQAKRFDVLRLFRGHQTHEEMEADLQTKYDRVVIDGKTVKVPRRWIALATNIAETSITFPRLTYVIDSGLTKRSSFNAVRGAQEFLTCHATVSELDQRRGRAGRTEDGYYFPMFDEETYDKADAHARPPVRRVDYAEVLHSMMAGGSGAADIVDFDWISKFSPGPC